MEIKELKQKIEEQREQNIKLFKSIPIASHEDPNNLKAEPILKEWRKGSEKLKHMIVELQGLETQAKKPIETQESIKAFVNGFGEATKRNITCSGYKRAEKRNEKAVLSFLGNS